MRRALAALVLVMSAVGLFVPMPATAVTGRDLTVTGTEVEMYPAFDAAIDRYAVTTTTNTAGTLDIAATPGSGESVTINGGSATHLTGLVAGDLVTVAFTGGSSPHSYTLMYLPAGFPKLTVSGGAKSTFPGVAPGLVGLTLNTFTGLPAYDAIVDRNGVPVWAVLASGGDLDLKQEPNGDLTVSQPPAAAGHTGAGQVTLDPLSNFTETARREVLSPLTNTDGHDSVSLPDGSTILIGYEPNGSTTDATIQKIAPDGSKVFEWTSAAYAAETTASTVVQNQFVPGDYAHINSVVSVEDGDIIASFRHLSSVYRIATVAHDGYAKGEVIWKLGGRHSTFTFPNDPDVTGPCAQHMATELPNGHILLFDNGTNGLCVDPADPVNGAGIARGHTRIKEYALDTQAGTATLVWSYPADTSKYAFFAGSASRLANDDTLIGWAADTNALVTEVNPAGDNLWELTTPATSPRYMTYRAALIAGPAIAMSGPADGAVVVRGDAVSVSATCTDWVDDTLTSCQTTGAAGGKLDTSTVGTHVWRVTGVDSSGATTSKSRTYVVRSARWLPDGLIRKAGSSTWKGSNLYGATGQTVKQRAHRRHTATSFWKVQNDGERTDTFLLEGTRSTRRFKVHYFAGSTDVTSAVVAGTYRTAALVAGASTVLRIEVTPTRRAHVGRSRTVRLHATSTSSTVAVDTVATQVTARR